MMHSTKAFIFLRWKYKLVKTRQVYMAVRGHDEGVEVWTKGPKMSKEGTEREEIGYGDDIASKKVIYKMAVH